MEEEEKRIEAVEEIVEDEKKLNLKREAFCQLYVNGDKELFGNGVQCYIEVYEPDQSKPNWYKTASASSSRMLANVKIINRITELLEEKGFNDENVSKQHLFLINQFVYLKTKKGAIDSYYKVKGKFIDHIDIKSGGKVIEGFNFIKPNGEDNKKDNSHNSTSS